MKSFKRVVLFTFFISFNTLSQTHTTGGTGPDPTVTNAETDRICFLFDQKVDKIEDKLLGKTLVWSERKVAIVRYIDEAVVRARVNRTQGSLKVDGDFSSPCQCDNVADLHSQLLGLYTQLKDCPAQKNRYQFIQKNNLIKKLFEITRELSL